MSHSVIIFDRLNFCQHCGIDNPAPAEPCEGVVR